MASLSLGDRLMLTFASLRVRPTVGDPCDKLSDDDTDGDTSAFGSGFPGHVAWGSPAHLEACARLSQDIDGERISHSTENARD